MPESLTDIVESEDWLKWDTNQRLTVLQSYTKRTLGRMTPEVMTEDPALLPDVLERVGQIRDQVLAVSEKHDLLLREGELGVFGTAKEAAKGVARGGAGSVADLVDFAPNIALIPARIAKAGGEVARKAAAEMFLVPQGMQEAFESLPESPDIPVIDTGLGEKTRELLAPDPRSPELLSATTEGLGQVAFMFAGAGFAGGIARMGTAAASKNVLPAAIEGGVRTGTAGLMGAASEAMGQYRDAIRSGATESEAVAAWASGALIGTSEFLPWAKPLRGTLNRVDDASGGNLKRYLKHRILKAGTGGASEAVQEFFQTAAGNAVAQQLYDESREVFEETDIATQAGGLVGLIMGYATAQGGKRRRKNNERIVRELEGELEGLPEDAEQVEETEAAVEAETAREGEEDLVEAALQRGARVVEEAQAVEPEVEADEISEGTRTIGDRTITVTKNSVEVVHPGRFESKIEISNKKKRDDLARKAINEAQRLVTRKSQLAEETAPQVEEEAVTSPISLEGASQKELAKHAHKEVEEGDFETLEKAPPLWKSKEPKVKPLYNVERPTTQLFRGQLREKIDPNKPTWFFHTRGAAQNYANASEELITEEGQKPQIVPLKLPTLGNNLFLPDYLGWGDLVEQLEAQGKDTAQLKEEIVKEEYRPGLIEEQTGSPSPPATWENYKKVFETESETDPVSYFGFEDGTELASSFADEAGGGAAFVSNRRGLVNALFELGFDSLSQNEGGMGQTSTLVSPELLRRAIGEVTPQVTPQVEEEAVASDQAPVVTEPPPFSNEITISPGNVFDQKLAQTAISETAKRAKRAKRAKEAVASDQAPVATEPDDVDAITNQVLEGTPAEIGDTTIRVSGNSVIRQGFNPVFTNIEDPAKRVKRVRQEVEDAIQRRDATATEVAPDEAPPNVTARADEVGETVPEPGEEELDPRFKTLRKRFREKNALVQLKGKISAADARAIIHNIREIPEGTPGKQELLDAATALPKRQGKEFKKQYAALEGLFNAIGVQEDVDVGGDVLPPSDVPIVDETTERISIEKQKAALEKAWEDGRLDEVQYAALQKELEDARVPLDLEQFDIHLETSQEDVEIPDEVTKDDEPYPENDWASETEEKEVRPTEEEKETSHRADKYDSKEYAENLQGELEKAIAAHYANGDLSDDQAADLSSRLEDAVADERNPNTTEMFQIYKDLNDILEGTPSEEDLPPNHPFEQQVKIQEEIKIGQKILEENNRRITETLGKTADDAVLDEDVVNEVLDNIMLFKDGVLTDMPILKLLEKRRAEGKNIEITKELAVAQIAANNTQIQISLNNLADENNEIENEGFSSLGMYPTGTSGRIPVAPTSPKAVKKARSLRAKKSKSEIFWDSRKTSIGKGIVYGGPGAGRIAEYFPGNARIVVRGQDLDSAAHEIAHKLDYSYGLIARWAQVPKRGDRKGRWVFDHELISAFSKHSSRPRDSIARQRAEGVAEWIRAWTVNPGAAEAAAPAFYKHFKNTVPQDVRDSLQDFGQDIRDYEALSALEQLRSMIASMPDSGEWAKVFRFAKGLNKLKAEPEEGEFNTTNWDRVKRQITDRLQPMVSATEYLKSIAGEQIPEDDPILLARLWHGGYAALDDIFENGHVDMTNRRVTKGGFADFLFAPFDHSTLESIERDRSDTGVFMIAQRILEKVPQIAAETGQKRKDVIAVGIGAGYTGEIKDSDLAKAVQILREFQADPDRLKVVTAGAARYRQWANANLRLLRDTGRIASDAYDQIVDGNQQYVAMERIMEVQQGDSQMQGVVDINYSGSKNLAVPDDVLKKFRGSGRPIIDPYETLIKSTAAAYQESGRNNVMRAFVELADKARNVYGELPNEVGSVIARISKADAAARSKSGNPQVLTVWIGGKEQHFHIKDKILFDTLRNTTRGLTWGALPVISQMARVFRWGVTHFPAFAWRNLIRDTEQRLIVSDESVKENLAHTYRQIREAARAATGKKSAVPWKSFLRLYGGDQAGHYMQNEVHYTRYLKTAMDELAEDKRNIIMDPAGMERFVKKGWNAYHDLIEGAERQNRLAEFRTAYHRAKKDGLDDYNAKLFAASQARGLIDFAVAGEFIRELNGIAPFTNAAVQGFRRNIKAIKTQGAWPFALRFFMQAVVPTYMFRAAAIAFGYEDEMDQMPHYLRDMFWTIKVGDNAWIRIPRTFEIAVVASGLDRAISWARGRQGAWDGYVGNLWGSVIPFDDTSAIAGMLGMYWQLSHNKDAFREEPIVPHNQEGVSLNTRNKEGERVRKNRSASTVGQGLQRIMENIAPDVTIADARNFDFWVRGQFGSTGKFALDVSDTILASIFKEQADDPEGIVSSGAPSIRENIGTIAGIGIKTPIYGSRDVQWILNRSEKDGVNIKVKYFNDFREAIAESFNAKDSKERQEMAEKIYKMASHIRENWDQIKEDYLEGDL